MAALQPTGAQPPQRGLLGRAYDAVISVNWEKVAKVAGIAILATGVAYSMTPAQGQADRGLISINPQLGANVTGQIDSVTGSLLPETYFPSCFDLGDISRATSEELGELPSWLKEDPFIEKCALG